MYRRLKHFSLWRLQTSIYGTSGVLFSEGFQCKTLEPPWENNQRNISCILGGLYAAVFYDSLRFGETYLLHDVPERSSILVHAGNWAGKESIGLHSDTDGCILLGERFGELKNQFAILESRSALKRFLNFTDNEIIALAIREAF